jgi:hypothetical protein
MRASLPLSARASAPASRVPASVRTSPMIQVRRQASSSGESGAPSLGSREPQRGIASATLRQRNERSGSPGTRRRSPGQPSAMWGASRSTRSGEARSSSPARLVLVWQRDVAQRGARISRWMLSVSGSQRYAASNGDSGPESTAPSDDTWIAPSPARASRPPSIPCVGPHASVSVHASVTARRPWCWVLGVGGGAEGVAWQWGRGAVGRGLDRSRRRCALDTSRPPSSLTFRKHPTPTPALCKVLRSVKCRGHAGAPERQSWRLGACVTSDVTAVGACAVG